jgi:hypothetical protein
VRFFQDETLIATHPNDLVPLGPLAPALVDEHPQNSMIYDWIRIRSYVNPEPTVSVDEVQSFRGGAPSRWAHRKIMAFRRDAFDLTEYAESLDAEINATADPIVKTELTTTAPPDARDYVSIQSMRISGQNNVDARKVGRLSADGTELLATSHKITRGSEDGNGYHHVAGVVDVRTSTAPILFQNAYASPELIEVRAAESVIIVLRLPK